MGNDYRAAVGFAMVPEDGQRCGCGCDATIVLPRPARDPDTGETRWWTAFTAGDTGTVEWSDATGIPEGVVVVSVVWCGGLRALCDFCWRGYCVDHGARPRSRLYPYWIPMPSNYLQDSA